MIISEKLPQRKSGILMAVSSLPSNYGIGTFGIEAYRFIDLLCETSQKYWQMLPLVPLGEGNSPYKSPSCFAGEPLYIDLDFLVNEGLLSYGDLAPFEQGENENVDFDNVRKYKLPLIKKAAERFNTASKDYNIFLSQNDYWLNPFAVFMAALKTFKTYKITDLPTYILNRSGEDYERFLSDNSKEIQLNKVIQYFFYAQYFELKRYANSKGVMLIGDLPFYVAGDSADVWANKNEFLVDEGFKPKLIAGVPPDVFSQDGQLWGNPVYDFDYQKSTGYKWWIQRLGFYFKLYDVVRLDHFRAFADYYVVEAGMKDAKTGEWKTGVGAEFFEKAAEKIPDMLIIAEDLGTYSNAVTELARKTGFPNMKVLQFAFSGDPNNPHLPSNYNENCVCYTGTHDNNTTLGFINNALFYETDMINRLYPESDDLPRPLNLVKAAMNSKANTVIIPIQDYLMLDEKHRMNIPGVPTGNWSFRVKKDYISDRLIYVIKTVARK